MIAPNSKSVIKGFLSRALLALVIVTLSYALLKILYYLYYVAPVSHLNMPVNIKSNTIPHACILETKRFIGQCERNGCQYSIADIERVAWIAAAAPSNYEYANTYGRIIYVAYARQNDNRSAVVSANVIRPHNYYAINRVDVIQIRDMWRVDMARYNGDIYFFGNISDRHVRVGKYDIDARLLGRKPVVNSRIELKWPVEYDDSVIFVGIEINGDNKQQRILFMSNATMWPNNEDRNTADIRFIK